MRGADDGAMLQLGRRYLERLPAAGPEKTHLVDKLWSNFAYIGLIRLCLPGAAIIHTTRDPRDTGFSCFAKLLGAFCNDLSELGRYYRWYAELMSHWRSTLPEGSIFELRYETLLADFEGEVRRLLSYCGLPWDARCLRFSETRRTVRTASAVQVRSPLFTESQGKSMPYRDQLAPFLAALGPATACQPAPASASANGTSSAS
jgi:hypothetical protein